MPNRYPLAESLLADKVEWYDLSLEFQLAALDVWFAYGRDGAKLFCHGA